MSLSNILNVHNLNRVPTRDYGTDKNTWHSYITNFYEERFLPYKDQSISLLEIGVETGASLKLWSEYFTNANSITGVDLTNGKLKPEFNSGATVVIGDAYTQETADSLGNFDIIIDDASNNHEDHLKLLELYIPKLNPGGIFVIEDIQNEGYFEDFTPVIEEPDPNAEDDPFAEEDSPEEDSLFNAEPQTGWTGLISKFNEVCTTNNLTNLSYEIVNLRVKSGRYDDLMFVVTAS